MALDACTGMLGSAHITLYLTEDSGECNDYKHNGNLTCTQIGYVYGGSTGQAAVGAKQFYRLRSGFDTDANSIGDNMWSIDQYEDSPRYGYPSTSWIAPDGH